MFVVCFYSCMSCQSNQMIIHSSIAPFRIGFFYPLHRGRSRLPHRQSPQPEQFPLRLPYQHRRLHELLLPRPPATQSPLHHRFPISPFPSRPTTVAAIPPRRPSKAPSGSTFRAPLTSPAFASASLRSPCSPPRPRSAPFASSACASASRSACAACCSPTIATVPTASSGAWRRSRWKCRLRRCC